MIPNFLNNVFEASQAKAIEKYVAAALAAAQPKVVESLPKPEPKKLPKVDSEA